MNKSQKLKSRKSRKLSRIKYGGMNSSRMNNVRNNPGSTWGSRSNIEKCMPSEEQFDRIIELDKKVAKLEAEKLELEAEKNTALEHVKRLMEKMKNWCKSKIDSGQLSIDSLTGESMKLFEIPENNSSKSKKRQRPNNSTPTPPPLNRSFARPAPAGRWPLKHPSNN
jgi:hypothetical protein